MLAEATTIQKAKELKDLALTAEDWSRRKGLGEKAVAHARLYARLASIRMGDLYARSEKAKGTRGAGRPKKGGVLRIPPNSAPTLAELGVSKKEMAEAQFLAKLPADIRQQLLDEKITLREAKRQFRRRQLAKEGKRVDVPQGKFRVIYADPPWKYGDSGLDDYGHVSRRASKKQCL